jgi:hypothetical protein
MAPVTDHLADGKRASCMMVLRGDGMKRLSKVRMFCFACHAALFSSGAFAASAPPHFTGRLALSPDPDGLHMTLLEKFSFVDADKTEWPVPKGAVTDGASIPRPLWSIAGGPFEGKYRLAAVIHDYYCDVRVRTWEAVDRMFYNAMLASGVDATQALIMYAAVRFWGPHWDGQTVVNSNLRTALLLETFNWAGVAAIARTEGGPGAGAVAGSIGPPQISSDLSEVVVQMQTSNGNKISMPWNIAVEASDRTEPDVRQATPAPARLKLGPIGSDHSQILEFSKAEGAYVAKQPKIVSVAVPTQDEVASLSRRVEVEKPTLDQIDHWSVRTK